MEYKSIVDCLNDFLYLRRLNGLTAKSLNCYKTFIRRFVNFIDDMNIYSLNNGVILSYIEELLGLSISRATVATYVRHLKVFLTWLCSEYPVNIEVEKIKIPKSPKKNPHIYNDSEIGLIFKTVYKNGTWIDLRNCAMVSFMLDSGLRQNEVCTLLKSNIDYEENIIKVLGKGQKERFVPMGNITLKFLKKYLAVCPFDGDYVFVSKTGSPISTNCVKLFMSKMSKKLPFEFSSHKLRHNFATNFLVDMYEEKGSMDMYSLMAIMGHESIETTKRYLHLANQRIYSKAHISHLDKALGGII